MAFLQRHIQRIRIPRLRISALQIPSPRKFFSDVRRRVVSLRVPSVRQLALYLPGVVFVSLGVAAVLAPQLLFAVIAGICLVVGCLFCLLVWQLLKLKARVDRFLTDFDGRIQIQAINVQEPVEETEEDEKKIIYH